MIMCPGRALRSSLHSEFVWGNTHKCDNTSFTYSIDKYHVGKHLCVDTIPGGLSYHIETTLCCSSPFTVTRCVLSFFYRHVHFMRSHSQFTPFKMRNYVKKWFACIGCDRAFDKWSNTPKAQIPNPLHLTIINSKDWFEYEAHTRTLLRTGWNINRRI